MPPARRDAAERAFIKSSQAITGWLWSNVIIGALEAPAAAIALSLLGVPGALVWAALTFFAALVPLLGPYLMAIPPILVALAVDPMKALWVTIFYLVLVQVTGNVVAPLVRSSRMKLHPVSQLFVVLAMGSVFGVLGALIATPVTGIFKAFYEEFFLSRQPPDTRMEQRVENMMQRRIEQGESVNMEPLKIEGDRLLNLPGPEDEDALIIECQTPQEFAAWCDGDGESGDAMACRHEGRVHVKIPQRLHDGEFSLDYDCLPLAEANERIREWNSADAAS